MLSLSKIIIIIHTHTHTHIHTYLGFRVWGLPLSSERITVLYYRERVRDRLALRQRERVSGLGPAIVDTKKGGGERGVY